MPEITVRLTSDVADKDKELPMVKLVLFCYIFLAEWPLPGSRLVRRRRAADSGGAATAFHRRGVSLELTDH